MDSFFDVICFAAGAVCMMLLWFWYDLKYDDYERGYQDAIDDIFDELKEYEDDKANV